MAGELDYNRDIKPLQGRYFGKLSASEKRSMQARYSEGWEEVEDRQYKRQEREDIKRNRDLSYQMNVEALQKRREDAAKKRRDDERLKTVANIVGGIVSADTGLDQRKEDLNKYMLSVPEIAKNPDSSPLFNAASSILQIEQAKAAKADAKKKAEMIAMRQSVLTGDVEGAALIAEESGDTSPEEAKQIEAAKKRRSGMQERATTGAQQALSATKLERRRKEINRQSKLLQGVYETESGDQVYDQPKDASQTHSKRHMAALRLAYAKQNNLKPSEVPQAMTGEQLIDEVYLGIEKERAELDEAEEALTTRSSIFDNLNR